MHTDDCVNSNFLSRQVNNHQPVFEYFNGAWCGMYKLVTLSLSSLIRGLIEMRALTLRMRASAYT